MADTENQIQVSGPNFCCWLFSAFGKSDDYYRENVHPSQTVEIWLIHFLSLSFLFPPCALWLIMRKFPIKKMRLYGRGSLVLMILVVLSTLCLWIPGIAFCIITLFVFKAVGKSMAAKGAFDTEGKRESDMFF